MTSVMKTTEAHKTPLAEDLEGEIPTYAKMSAEGVAGSTPTPGTTFCKRETRKPRQPFAYKGDDVVRKPRRMARKS